MGFVLSCIEYMESCFGELNTMTHDKWRRLDIPKLTQRHPFLGYAVSNWLFHFAESHCSACDLVPGRLADFCLKVDLLYWLESWYSMNKRDPWSLLRHIRKIEYNAYHQLEDGAQGDRVCCALFVYQWSKAMSQLLERHGRSCEDEPSYIHFVDPASFEEECDDGAFFSNFTPHQPPIHIPHFRIGTGSRHKAHSSFRKAKKANYHRFTDEILGLFHVEIDRKIVITAEYVCTAPKLYCQSLLDCQSLQPMACAYEAGRHYKCEGYSINPCGKHIAIFYRSASSTAWDNLMEQSHHLFVYEVLERPKFEDNSEIPWCKATMNASFESQYSVYCPQSVALDTDCTVLCPYGRVNISSGLVDDSFSPLSGHKVLDSIQSLKDPTSFGGVAFIAGTQTQVLLDRLNKNLIKLRVSDGYCITSTLPWSDAVMLCVSPMGRFVVLQESRSHAPCLLYNFITNTTKSLVGSERISKPFGSRLRFSTDEQYLIAIFPPISNRANSHIGKWIDLSEEIEARISPGYADIYGLYVSTMNEPTYLATSENWIKVDLKYLRAPLSHSNMMRDFTCKQQVSVHGDRLAIVIHPLRDPGRHM